MTDTPVSGEKLAEAKAIGAEIRTAMEAARSSGTRTAHPSARTTSASSFMDLRPTV
jgi:hypothetical protein